MRGWQTPQLKYPLVFYLLVTYSALLIDEMEGRDCVSNSLSDLNRLSLVVDANTYCATKGGLTSLNRTLLRLDYILVVGNDDSIGARRTGLLVISLYESIVERISFRIDVLLSEFYTH